MTNERDAWELVYSELRALRQEQTARRGWMDPRLIVTVALAILSALVVAVSTKAVMEERLGALQQRVTEQALVLDKMRDDLITHRTEPGLHNSRPVRAHSEGR